MSGDPIDGETGFWKQSEVDCDWWLWKQLWVNRDCQGISGKAQSFQPWRSNRERRVVAFKPFGRWKSWWNLNQGHEGISGLYQCCWLVFQCREVDHKGPWTLEHIRLPIVSHVSSIEGHPWVEFLWLLIGDWMYFRVLTRPRVKWRGLRPLPWLPPWGRRAKDSRGAGQYFSTPSAWCLASENQQEQTVEEVQEFHPHGREVLGFQGEEEADSSIGDNWKRRVWWSPCESWYWKGEGVEEVFSTTIEVKGINGG